MSGGSGTARSGGIGFTGALTILFVGLKLTGFIDWSWWWVLSPLWIPLLVAVPLIALLVWLSARERKARRLARSLDERLGRVNRESMKIARARLDEYLDAKRRERAR